MTKKREYKPVGALAQVERIIAASGKLAPGVAASFWAFIGPLVIEWLQQLIANCPDDNAERIANRSGRLGRIRQIPLVNSLVKEARLDGERIRRKDARAILAACVADARANPKDTAASVRELRGE